MGIQNLHGYQTNQNQLPVQTNYPIHQTSYLPYSANYHPIQFHPIPNHPQPIPTQFEPIPEQNEFESIPDQFEQLLNHNENDINEDNYLIKPLMKNIFKLSNQEAESILKRCEQAEDIYPRGSLNFVKPGEIYIVAQENKSFCSSVSDFYHWKNYQNRTVLKNKSLQKVSYRFSFKDATDTRFKQSSKFKKDFFFKRC